ncbi:MAG: phasin family protein [Chloroflexi bacterium]|nr:phasin family protein [Chloroflexota bacterium]
MTNEVVIEVAEEKNGGLSGMVVDNVHKVFLVGLGAAAMAQDELFNLVDKFVEQGEETEKKVLDSVNDMVDDRKKRSRKSKQTRRERIQQTHGSRFTSSERPFPRRDSVSEHQNHQAVQENRRTESGNCRLIRHRLINRGNDCGAAIQLAAEEKKRTKSWPKSKSSKKKSAKNPMPC